MKQSGLPVRLWTGWWCVRTYVRMWGHRGGCVAARGNLAPEFMHQQKQSDAQDHGLEWTCVCCSIDL